MNDAPLRKAIIVGASSGIGRELAKLLAVDGYAIAIAARRVSLLNELQHELHNGALVRQLDVSNIDDSSSVLTALIEEMGGVDLIVFAAGSGELNEALDWELERASVETNVLGFTAVANIALKHFIKRKSGHLAAISSIAAIRGGRASPAYNASKAFMSNYLEGLRQKVNYLGLPIVVTDIKPGFVETAMAKGEGLFWVSSADKAARQIYSAIKRKRRHAYVTKRWKLVAWLLRIMPDYLYNRL